LDYANVNAALLDNGTTIATGSSTCTQCFDATAKAMATVRQGDTITNHGTWDVMLPAGWSWQSWPAYCSKVSAREVQCVRSHRFTAGKNADLDDLGVDVGTIAFG
jgi:hypothetical protein